MLEKSDLQAIEGLIEEANKRTLREAIAYSESTVERKLDLIKEGLDMALELHTPAERIDRIENDVIALKGAVGKHEEEIERLKMA